MPRPNVGRTLRSEAGLARRIAYERQERGWSLEGLAKRMSDAGCNINASAIFKIEKGDPPRRISVDELVALAAVFAERVDDLLLPPNVVFDKVAHELVEDLTARDGEFVRARDARDQAIIALREYLEQVSVNWKRDDLNFALTPEVLAKSLSRLQRAERDG